MTSYYEHEEPAPKNPKLQGSGLFDCVPQRGPCPIGCNQCYYNRTGEGGEPLFYAGWEPVIPRFADVGGGIARMNCGNDSNNEQGKVIEVAARYREAFFNTSRMNLDFPGPVVWTANPEEEEEARLLRTIPDNLMFVRLRTSSTNLRHVASAAGHFSRRGVGVCLTFMAYYDHEPQQQVRVHNDATLGPCYEWKKRHINPYWCPTQAFVTLATRWVRARSEKRLVWGCEIWCRDCRQCEAWYWVAKKRMRKEAKEDLPWGATMITKMK